MTKTNFSAKSNAVAPRNRNLNRKSAPAGFAEILDQQAPPPRDKPKPAATVKPKAKPERREEGRFDPGPDDYESDERGPSGTVVADTSPRPPIEDAIANGMRLVGKGSPGPELKRQTLPYARTRGEFVRTPTFSDLGRDAAAPRLESLPPAQAYADDPWLPPAPTWGQSRGPDPELVQTPSSDEAMATAGEISESEKAARQGTIPLIPDLGWESLEPDVEPMVSLEEALGAFEEALTVRDDASSVEESSANFAPIADFDSPASAGPHSAAFLSAVPTVGQDAGQSYGSDGNVFTSADPGGPTTREVEVFRSALNRAAITVDTDDGQIELAITTAGKHVMIEATAASGFTDAIQRDLDALRSALDRHDLELTELSFGEPQQQADSSETTDDSSHRRGPSLVRDPDQVEGSDHDLGFGEEGRQTWVIPTGFRVVA